METKKEICAIISGAPNDCASFLKCNINPNNCFIICADLGWNKCQEAGFKPELIIGDFDSSSRPDIDSECVVIPKIKDDSDTFYCVKKAVEMGYKDIEIYNAIGNRVDHTFANILCLDYCKKSNVSCTIIDEHNKMYLVTDSLVIKHGKYDYFSIFAFLEDAKGVSIDGAFYELHDRDINQYEQYGLSNRFNREEAIITVKKGCLLVIESTD